ncbi:DNA binding protein [Streptomyces phage Success]|uniref:DNA binding protein n=1 Tax=Streptomyces phage Success TaxID=2999013 RepID=A0A9E8M5Z3_9CAUD|nr:DNA binding protein [Streptomyces phage Success]WAB08857.1 DNA binding protein [Streptomyces phage Success]
MKQPEFRPGDRVSHFREPGNVGKVICLEKRGVWPFRRWVYWVSWRAGYAPVPLAWGLWPVHRTDAQQIAHQEAA